MKAAVGIEPTHRSFADFRLTTWLRRQKAEDEIRTRDLHLGKVELYHWATSAKGEWDYTNSQQELSIKYYV